MAGTPPTLVSLLSAIFVATATKIFKNGFSVLSQKAINYYQEILNYLWLIPVASSS